MVFSSLLFLFRFFPIVLIFYFMVPRTLKNTILFLSSFIFYAWGEPVYIIIMLFSTIVDFIHGYLVDKFKRKHKNKQARLVVLSSVFINLGLLGFFKYSDFLIYNLNVIFGTEIPLLQLALPIGISFYTFQTMSYTIDIYRGEAPVQKNIISFGAYVALFPQLIAGPIVRYQTIAEQLNHRKETVDSFSEGILQFIVGLGKKVLLANNIGLLWDFISKEPIQTLPVTTAWLGITAFAFQIYFDFSGYSDMAIGLGKMFGFQFLENFRYPYTSKSITEFWRRWHISLGTWFREYVYIPLGGNRKGKWNHLRNIMLVWFLTGIWHGASWNFVVWGVYFGVILIIEKWFFIKYLEKLPNIIKRIYTIFLIWISWVIFAHDSIKSGLQYVKVMFGFGQGGFYNTQTLYLVLNYGILIFILIVGATDLPKRIMGYISKNNETIGVVVMKILFIISIFVVSVAYLVDASYNPFLYFRF